MIEKFSRFCIRQRVAVVLTIGLTTLVLAVFASGIKIETVFADLMPQNHPYIKVHNQFKETFGGSNMVSIMLEVDKGDIFNIKVLQKIQLVTQDLQMVQGVNPYQIISLASKKLKEVKVVSGDVNSKPLMYPELPKDDAEVALLKEKVIQDPMIYGGYVSRDMKAALITADFYDQLIDYDVIFKQINDIVSKIRGDGVKVRIVGEPILYGWVRHFLPETFHLFLLTICGMAIFLFVVVRSWRGTLLPLLAGLISASWALGIAKLLGFHFDPLIIVVAFLITARSISHSTQLVTRFDDLIQMGIDDPKVAAQMSMASLFKPGMLGVIADAGCMMVVVLTPIPLLQKVAIVATVWVMTISIGAVVMTPVLLSWVRKPKKFAHPINLKPFIEKILNLCNSVVVSRMRYVILATTIILFIAAGVYSLKLTIGDANPGSPILWPNSVYNQDATALNTKFQGSDRMFVVYSGKSPDTLKQPKVLHNMLKFQRNMEAQPEIGGSLSLGDILPVMRRVIHEDNPRYQEIANTVGENGELAYLFTSGSDPGDIDRFVDPLFENGSVTLFFRDHRGDTIRTAISRIGEFAKKHPLPDVKILLAGGFVGVIAAINEIILSGQIEAIALGLLVLMIAASVTYRSSYAGAFFMIPVLLANVLTFAYMTWKGVGMNINTVPVAALGIGLGVDYAFYIVDGIKEEIANTDNLLYAINKSMLSAGRGVIITAGALVCSVVLWWFSSLRFQAEMGIMMGIWLCISAISALIIMPTIIFIFRPEFVVGKKKDMDFPG